MISKILTLSRPAILRKLFSLSTPFDNQTSQGAREYFDIGLPLYEPFSPTGTIAILLERSFLERNEMAFKWASIPDNGGVRYGFLPSISSQDYKKIRLDYLQFLEILKSISSFPENCIQDIIHKRKSEIFCDSIKEIVHSSVIESMLSQPMQAARRIEFCLEGDFDVKEADVRTVYIPNTYSKIFSPSNSKFTASKIVYYNPRYSVIDRVKKDEASHHWSV